MNQKLTDYLNSVFTPYDGVKSVTELKGDLLSDLQNHWNRKSISYRKIKF